MFSYFIFNGVDSRSYGIRCEQCAPVMRPEERVENVKIPGREGDVTLTEGEDIYDAYMQNIKFSVPESHRDAVIGWLRGEGMVTFSTEPDMEQPARVVKQIVLDRFGILNWFSGEVVFYVQPYKKRTRGDLNMLTLADEDTIVNRGTVASRPIILVDAGNDDFSVTIGGSTIVVSASEHEELEDGDIWEIDCDTMEVFIVNEDGEIVESATQYSSGSFPPIPKGTSTVRITGVDEITILPNFRYL